jgi:hypothetical protein
MTGRLFKLAYQLRMHKFADAQLDVLLRNLSILAALIIVVQWLVRGRPALPAWHWIVLGGILLVAFGLIVLRVWAARASYTHFAPDAGRPAPVPRVMVPDDKEACTVSGHFEVEAKARRLANLTAYWRTFGSREHAVMAIQHPSRFLLGGLPPEIVGMWYIFFQPQDVIEVTPGAVAFGAESRPGLRIVYLRLPSSEGQKPKKPVRETIYLAFADELARDRVWADLLADQSIASGA